MSLGLYADAVEAAPVTTLTVTGALIGAAWGALLGFSISKLVRGTPSSWAAAGAIALGGAFAAEGYSSGKELERWMSSKPVTSGTLSSSHAPLALSAGSPSR